MSDGGDTDVLLNTPSTTLNPTIIENITQVPITLSLGDAPTLVETELALGPMANGKAMGPDGYLLS